MKNFNVQNNYIYEIFHTCASFYYGKYKYVNCNHYIRLANPLQNYNKSISESLIVKLIFNKSDNDDLIKFIDYFSKKFNIDKRIFFNITKKYFYSPKIDKINFYLRVFYFFYIRLKLGFFSLKNLVNTINFFYFIKR